MRDSDGQRIWRWLVIYLFSYVTYKILILFIYLFVVFDSGGSSSEGWHYGGTSYN